MRLALRTIDRCFSGAICPPIVQSFIHHHAISVKVVDANRQHAGLLYNAQHVTAGAAVDSVDAEVSRQTCTLQHAHRQWRSQKSQLGGLVSLPFPLLPPCLSLPFYPSLSSPVLSFPPSLRSRTL